jgi:hypothetical protein
MTEGEQRILDMYLFMKSALELCEAEVIMAREPHGPDEIMAIVEPMTEEFGAFWAAFREK